MGTTTNTTDERFRIMVKTVPSVPANLLDIAILLDVDGTILDIAPAPDKVRASAALRRTLERLLERTAGAVALVSGRQIDSIDRIFAPLRLPAIGGHGAEMRPSADADVRRLSASLDGALKRRILAIAKADSAILVEDKGYAMALHYRQAPGQEGAIKSAVAAIRNDFPAEAIEVLPGKAVVEIKVAGFDKGTALRELMTYPNFAGRRPIFIGDDTTDEAAFAAMPEFRGVPISVGREVSGVTDCFDTPSDVRRWLQRLADGGGMDGQ